MEDAIAMASLFLTAGLQPATIEKRCKCVLRQGEGFMFGPVMIDEEKMRQSCLAAGIMPEQHCCLLMAYYISDPVEIAHQGPNEVLMWLNSWDEYMIPISRIGYSATCILHCPWCGFQLPASKREAWYRALYALGYNDPGNDDIPEEFTTDRWWRALTP